MRAAKRLSLWIPAVQVLLCLLAPQDAAGMTKKI
jgi:hypothetical protein